MLSQDIAIDLGTANTLVYLKGKGVVSNEPSVVAVKVNVKGPREIVACGHKAREMFGRTPEAIKAIRPLKEGVIADYETTEALLRYFFEKAKVRRGLFKPRVVICIPHGITDVERKAVRESAIAAGAREVFLIEEPLAAAIGAGLPVTEACGSMVVDIGGGTTEVAVISLKGIVFSRSLRVGGDNFDEAIVGYVKRQHNLIIGDRTAEHIKLTLGAAMLDHKNVRIQVRGRDLVEGLPRTISISQEEVRYAIDEPIKQIIQTIRLALENTPPELSGDILDKGITLTGGGSLLKHFDELIQKETGLPVVMSEDPMTAVVIGSGKVLDRPELMREVVIK